MSSISEGGSEVIKHSKLWYVWKYILRMTPRHWAWLHFKLALGLGWGTAILFVAPPTIKDKLNEDTIQIWALGTIVGAVICIIGIFMTVARDERWKIWGLGVEGIGIILLGGGPLQYFLLQVGYLFDGEFASRYQLTWFAYAMLAAIIVRLVIIVPQFLDVVVAIKREKEVIDRASGL